MIFSSDRAATIFAMIVWGCLLTIGILCVASSYPVLTIVVLSIMFVFGILMTWFTYSGLTLLRKLLDLVKKQRGES